MIKHKSKPCKGNANAKGYGCGKPTLHRVYGLGKMCGCYSDWLLNSEQGKIKLQKSIIKATAPRLKAEKELEEARVAKRKRTGLGWLIKNTVIACHEYIRARDKGKNCISCQQPYNPDHQAGHYFKSELFSTIKFNEDNIHGQCKGCNLMKEGNESQYRVNLPNRIGKERFEALNHLASNEKKVSHKWEREDLKQIRAYYKSKLKEL